MQDDKKNKEEREKKLVMWTGVSFFMFLILFLWFFNIKGAFRGTEKYSSNDLDIKEFANEFSDSIEEIKLKLNEFKLDENISEKTINNKEGVSEKSINDLKERLEASSTITVKN